MTQKLDVVLKRIGENPTKEEVQVILTPSYNLNIYNFDQLDISKALI